MCAKISKRLLDIVEALPLKEGIRVLEIGCGSGVAAREIANRFEKIYVLGVDRSKTAITQASELANKEILQGKLEFKTTSIEKFDAKDVKKFDLAFAIRVGALDGRHPEIENEALSVIKRLLKKNAKLFIDGGNPLTEIEL